MDISLGQTESLWANRLLAGRLSAAHDHNRHPHSFVAADTGCTNNGTLIGYRDKAFRVEGGRMAITGHLPSCMSVVEWHCAGRGGPIPSGRAGKETGAVIWIPDTGTMTLIEEGIECALPSAEFHAFGAGRDVALGAMAAGASAAGAVAIACRFDTATFGPIVVLGPDQAGV